ncbi:hypothetical protein JCM1841_005813 [Sporobolomyces salmonicolor]
MSAPYDPYESASGSDSDDAPEEVTLSSAKKGQQESARKAQDAQRRAAQERREKNRALDKRLKEAKRKGKGKGKQVALEEEDEDEEEEEEDEEGQLESDEEDNTATAPPQVGKKTTYLDESVFAEAAAHYDPASKQTQAPAGQGKMAAKRALKEEKRRKREAREAREAMVKEGGQRDVGGITLQHLPTSSGPALTSASHPSHTSATHFLSQRLYSKKRQVAVLDASRQERSNPKKAKKGGLSAETRMLLGLDEGEKGSGESEKDKQKRKKRSLLLQAEGQRKSASTARPIAAVRRGAKPAVDFAVSAYRP